MVLPLLIEIFNQPVNAKELLDKQWDTLICQARAANLLARLGVFLQERGMNEWVPGYVRRHFESEQFIWQAVNRSTLWEAERIYEALLPLGIKIVFLKGAAYCLAELKASQGRVYQDIDILVPKERIKDVERMLMWHGWIDRTEDEYDQQYYRQWMHELPPKYHKVRGTVLDVHHNLLPETCMTVPEVLLIFDSAILLPQTDYSIPCPVDLVIHSATHLFHEGEFNNGLRDISDLNLLISELSVDSSFWRALTRRSNELNLGRPLFYALRYAKHIFRCQIPDEVMEQMNKQSPGRVYVKFMDFLFLRALMPDHPSCNDRWTGLARLFLYIRSHYLRMPLYLLIPHLLRKGWIRLSGKSTH